MAQALSGALVFVKRGSVQTSEGKIASEFYVVTPETRTSGDRSALLDSPTVIYRGIGKGLQPGGMLSINPGEKPGSILPATEKYLGVWPDVELRTTWAVQERAVQAELDARRRRKTEGKADPVEELVAPLRRVYRTLPSPARAQLLARIIHYLTAQS